MAFPDQSILRRAGGDWNRVLNQEGFLHFLDLEVKRSRRYQNFFCILMLGLKEIPDHNGGKPLHACFQKMAHLIAEEMRDSDILGRVGEKRLGVILPYADLSAGDITRRRFENTLRFYDFTRDGYQVFVEQVCFPSDVTDTPDLIRKIIGTDG